MKRSLGLIMLATLNHASLVYADTTNLTPPTENTTSAPTADTQAPATTTTTPATPQTATTPTTTTEAPIPDNINCTYAISPQVAQVNPELVTKWATKAGEQSFTFDHAQINAQLEQLKACFTNQGWKGFQDALTKSGNLAAIQSQELTMSAMTQGTPSISENKSNEWKVTFPIQVVYQNKQQKLTQDLNIELLIGRKLTGDLGIMQLIATPRNTAPQEPAPKS